MSRKAIQEEGKLRRLELGRRLREKLKEAVSAVLPIMVIVLLLCFSIAPISPSVMLEYIIGAAMLVLGMMFFTLGAEMAMTPMGEKVGSSMTQSRKLWIMIVLGFILGFIITISEPDLQVLAEQVPSVPNLVLVVAVAVGVGIFPRGGADADSVRGSAAAASGGILRGSVSAGGFYAEELSVGGF